MKDIAFTSTLNDFERLTWNGFIHDFCLTVHHQLGKVIQMNQPDSTMIYCSISSAQHVSGNILPIIRSVRLRYLQHMVSCCCGGQVDGERQVRFQSFTAPDLRFNFSFKCHRLYDVSLELKYVACFTLYCELSMNTWKKRNICNV